MQHYCKTAILMGIFVFTAMACNTKKKTAATSPVTKQLVPVSNIDLYNKPLDTIIKHTVNQRWKLVYSIGGMTGKDKNEFDNFYYIITNEGKLVSDYKGKHEETSYEWLKSRDIFTGDSTYILSGAVQWKIVSITNDTLRVSDNFTDGYHYALIRVK